MQIKVVGFDPSMRNWGAVSAMLDLDTGILSSPHLDIFQTTNEPSAKQVRVNSHDLLCSEELFTASYAFARDATVTFVEVPVGSQSASAMKGYGICLGVLGSLRALGVNIIEVSEAESKKTFTGNRFASKREMIEAALILYPDANWPRNKGKVVEGKAEHMADAIAAIYAGVHTQQFKQLMTLLKQSSKE